jgi:hypothetical protein
MDITVLVGKQAAIAVRHLVIMNNLEEDSDI